MAAVMLAAAGISSASAYSINGVVQTGGTNSTEPLANVSVTLFEATDGQPTVLGQATTDGSGQFTITSSKNTSSSIFFVSAVVTRGVELLAVLGPNLPDSGYHQ